METHKNTGKSLRMKFANISHFFPPPEHLHVHQAVLNTFANNENCTLGEKLRWKFIREIVMT